MQHSAKEYPFSIEKAAPHDVPVDATVRNQSSAQIFKFLVNKLKQLDRTSLSHDMKKETLTAIDNASTKILKAAQDFGCSVEAVLTLLEEALGRRSVQDLVYNWPGDAEKLSADLLAEDKELVPHQEGYLDTRWSGSTIEELRHQDPCFVLWFITTPGVCSDTQLLKMYEHFKAIYYTKIETKEDGTTHKFLVFKQSQEKVISMVLMNCLSDVCKTCAL